MLSPQKKNCFDKFPKNSSNSCCPHKKKLVMCRIDVVQAPGWALPAAPRSVSTLPQGRLSRRRGLFLPAHRRFPPPWARICRLLGRSGRIAGAGRRACTPPPGTSRRFGRLYCPSCPRISAPWAQGGCFRRLLVVVPITVMVVFALGWPSSSCLCRAGVLHRRHGVPTAAALPFF